MAENIYSTQVIREAEEIEDYKLKLLEEAEKLAYNQNRPTLSSQLPAYSVAGFTPAQLTALSSAKTTGIGSFDPYMTDASTAFGSAYDTTGEAANILRNADTRYQFEGAGGALRNAAGATGAISSGIGQIGQGLGYLDLAGQRAAASDTTGQFGDARSDLNMGLGALATGQNMAALSSQAELRPATAAIAQGIGGLTQAQQLALGSGAADFSGSQALLQQAGGRDLNRATQGYDPTSATAFMDPYKKQVLDETIKQMDRQSKIAGQNLSAQAVRSGAFGGEREGVQRAEMERNLLDQKAAATANLLSQGYGQSQAQAMQAFEQQQGRQLQAAGQRANIGQQVGAQAAQQAQLGHLQLDAAAESSPQSGRSNGSRHLWPTGSAVPRAWAGHWPTGRAAVWHCPTAGSRPWPTGGAVWPTGRAGRCFGPNCAGSAARRHQLPVQHRAGPAGPRPTED